MDILYNITGTIMRFFYETVQGLVAEPESISYFAMTFMLMAVLNKLISIPLMSRTTASTQNMQDLQPQLEEIEKKYGYDERILQQKQMEFYQEHGISTAGCSSCLPMILQMVFVIAMFQVLRNPGTYLFDNPSEIDQIARNFLWIDDLLKPDPYWFGLPLINALTQFAVQRLNPQRAATQNSAMDSSMKMMNLTMPIMFFFIALNFESGLLLYWAFSNIIEIIFRGIKLILMKRNAEESATN